MTSNKNLFYKIAFKVDSMKTLYVSKKWAYSNYIDEKKYLLYVASFE